MDMRYEEEVKKYGKKDAIVALCAFVAVTAIIAVSDVLSTILPVSSTVWGFVLRAIIVGVAIAIVLVKKQGLASIGIHIDKLWPTLRFSALLILVFFIFGVVPGLIFGWEFCSLGTIIPILFITMINAAGEDIFFVGYFQTRLHGLIKNNVLAIFVGAVGFALAHVPALLISPFPAGGWDTMLILWIIAHTFLVLIFRRHFSIIPVIIAHTLLNFLSTGGLWNEFNFADNESLIGFSMLLILLSLVVVEVVCYRRAKKAQA